MKIPLSELKKDDYVYCTGDSGFCQSSIEQVINTSIRFDEMTGAAYTVIHLSGDRLFDSRHGDPITPPLAYYLVPFDQIEGERIITQKKQKKENERKLQEDLDKEKEKILSKLTPLERHILGF